MSLGSNLGAKAAAKEIITYIDSPQNLDRFTDVEFKFYLNIQRMYEAGLI